MIQNLLLGYPLAAPAVFICAHLLLAVFFLPCSPMTLMAGALWGGAYGLLVSMTAAVISSAATFLLARRFLHDRMEVIFSARYPKLATLLQQVSINDWKVIALAQLNPLVPASTMGYAFGLTPVTYKRYLIFATIFMLPLQAMFVWAGRSVMNMLTSEGPFILNATMIFLIAAFILFGKQIYRKASLILGVGNGA